MANTITNTTILASPTTVVKYITIASDGTEETGTVIYDSSAIATVVGDSDTLDSTITRIYACVAAASTARVSLLWDATTDVLAFSVPVSTNPTYLDLRGQFPMGGLPNQGATGKTGDILLTTTGLESGDSITLVLEIRRN